MSCTRWLQWHNGWLPRNLSPPLQHTNSFCFCFFNRLIHFTLAIVWGKCISFEISSASLHKSLKDWRRTIRGVPPSLVQSQLGLVPVQMWPWTKYDVAVSTECRKKSNSKNKQGNKCVSVPSGTSMAFTESQGFVWSLSSLCPAVISTLKLFHPSKSLMLQQSLQCYVTKQKQYALPRTSCVLL